VTQYIVRHPERFELAALSHPDAVALAPLRWTLDRSADYEFIRAVFERLYPDNPQFGMSDVLQLVARAPDIQALAQAAHGAST
jgi:spore coat polysaccharide biosynthesis protein SpsF